MKTVIELIKLGACLNRKDFRGFTALHHAATTGDRALIEALISRGAEAERDIFGLQPVDVLPIGSDHSAFGHQLESKSRGFEISVTSGMLEKNRSVFYFDIQVSVPQGRHGRLFVQVCHAVDGNYCLKRLPPLYKLIGATRLSTGGTRITAAVISLRVTGVLPNRKYRVLCERESGDVVAISNPLLVSKEAILFQNQCEDYMNVKKPDLIEEVRKESDREILEDLPLPATVQDALSALNTSLDELENDATAAELKASPPSSTRETEDEEKSLPVRLSIAKVRIRSVVCISLEVTRHHSNNIPKQVYDGSTNTNEDTNVEDEPIARFASRSLVWEDLSDEDTPSNNNSRPTSLRWESIASLDDAIDKAGTAQ